MCDCILPLLVDARGRSTKEYIWSTTCGVHSYIISLLSISEIDGYYIMLLTFYISI